MGWMPTLALPAPALACAPSRPVPLNHTELPLWIQPIESAVSPMDWR